MKLGFVGIGWIGLHRMKKILEGSEAKASLLFEPSEEMLAKAREAAPDARIARSFEEVLDADLDGVVIATPSALHAEQSIRALESGKAVFCQKPLGRTAEEVRRVVDTARRTNRLLSVDLSYRYTDGMRMIRNLLREGEIGEVYGVDLVFHNAYGPDKEWFYRPELSGGGCVMDLGVHLVDLALWSLDFPRVEGTTSRLFTGGKPLERSDQVEDYAVARIDLAGGTAVQLACSWRLSVGFDCLLSVSFYGSRGGLSLKNLGGSFYDFIAERYRGTAREVLSQPDEWGGRAAVAWAKALATSQGFDREAESLVTVAEVLDSIYGKSELSRKIQAPDFWAPASEL